MDLSELKKKIIKSTYYSNWGDNFGYPIAFATLPILSKFSFITPNGVSLVSFGLFTFGSLSLFLSYPFHLFIAALCITAGYIGDDIDGQLARYTKKTSNIGDFLDKVLDVLKIFIITSSLSYAVFLHTQDILSIYLGFIACFFFLFRYYIKLETMFGQIDRDKNYLEKSADVRNKMIEEKEAYFKKNSHTLLGIIKVLAVKHRILFLIDEAEFALIVSLGAIINLLPLTLWILAISQVFWGFYRFYERGVQVNTNSPDLLKPMRK